MANELTPDESKCAERTKAVWDEAKMAYGLPDTTKFILKFQDKMRIYHEMKKRGSRAAVGKAHYDRDLNTATVTLNREAIVQNITDMLEDTIPHEIAHIVCMVRPVEGGGHDEGWQRVCKRLGGSGQHRYSYGDFDMRIRKRRNYVYDIPGMGRKLLTDVKHRRLQDEVCIYRDPKSGIPIHKEHWTGEIV